MKTAARLRSLCLASGSAVLLLGVTAASADDQKEEKPLSEKMTKMDEKVYFAFDDAGLNAQARSKLDDVANWAKQDESRKVVLAGHADEVGAKGYNFDLAKERAEAARDYLQMQDVPAGQIEIVSYGEEHATGEGPTRTDRKVVFLIDEGADETAPSATPGQMGTAPSEGYDQSEFDAQAELNAQAELDATYDDDPNEPADTAYSADRAEDTTDDTVAPPPAEPYGYRAETYTDDDDDRTDHLVTPDGMSFAVGGGVMNFIDDDTRGFTDLGGSWNARLTYGTRSVIAGELAYNGSAQEINALGLDNRAALLGSGGEAAARINIGTIPYVQPYALAGVGATNYSIVNEDFNTSNVDDSETVFHVPLGAGVGFRASGFLFDVRGTYRPAFQDGLIDNQEDQIGETDGDAVAELDSWGATASAGIEF